MPINTMVDLMVKCLPLFLETKKDKVSYEKYPEFQPYIGRNYENNSERTLVISEIFSTKNPPKLKKDESYCEYVLKNTNDPSCVNIQQALQRHDENLTAENIAFCFFIHKEKVKVGSYRSDFSPKDLDNAINTLVPLINLLKPKKIVFLGSQTKRTVERRSGSKALNGKTFEQFLAGLLIKTEIILLRSRGYNQAAIELNKSEQFHFKIDRSIIETKNNFREKNLFSLEDILSRLDKSNKAVRKLEKNQVECMLNSTIFAEKKLETDECIMDFTHIAKRCCSILFFIVQERCRAEEDNPGVVIKHISYEDVLQILKDGLDYDCLGLEDCKKRCLAALQHYYRDLLNGETTYEKDVRNAFVYISKKMNVVAVGLYFYQTSAEIILDRVEFKESTILSFEYMCRFLNSQMETLQQLLIPIKAIIENFDDNTNNSGSYMLRKIEFVKDLVKELRPKDDDEPGYVMSLQMVAKRLNESNPPITTALGKKYDGKGKGVIVLLRNVYKTLVESSSEEDQNIAAEMLHCFTKRPVDKLLERTEDNVTEEEYWKPFKNMDAKES